MNKTVYIVGEIDLRLFEVCYQTVILKKNLRLRYPTMYYEKPEEIIMNYEQEPNCVYLRVKNCEEIKKNRHELISKCETRIVMLEGKYNAVVGCYGLKVIWSKIEPVVKDYNMG